MSDPDPESLTLRYLRALDERTERMERAMVRAFGVLNARIGAVETCMLSLATRITALEEWSAETTHRLDRIDRRLNLVETP